MDLSIDEFDALHYEIAKADKEAGHAALYGTRDAVERAKAKISAARERLKYYDVGALLATMKFDGWQWQPIATLPEEDKLVMAWVPDGRMMIWRTTILRSALEGEPSHLQFPATHWREMPSGPATANSSGDNDEA